MQNDITRSLKNSISFIIPVYNSDAYIKMCVNSILQSARNTSLPIELILVNDGSTDNSLVCCEELAEKDNRIHVLNQKNMGICTARNSGLHIAKGEWICFIDHDDVFDVDGLSVIEKVIDEKCDIIYFGFDEFYSEEKLDKGKVLGDEKEFSQEEISKLQWDCLCRYKANKPLMSYRLLTTPWGKIYKKDFLDKNELRFIDSLRREEDVTFNLMCLSRCKEAKWYPYSLYHYRKFISSESHSYKARIVQDAEQVLAVYKDIIDQYYPSDHRMQELYDFRILWELLYCVVLGPAHINNPKNYFQRKKEFKEIINLEMYVAVFEKVDVKCLPMLHRVLGIFVKQKCFLALVIMTRVEALINKIR